MSKTRFCFIRHGETSWNAERRIQGQMDIPLNAMGAAQARAVARGLQRETFAAIYSSDLGRARRTAEESARQLGVRVRLDPQLRERHYGIFESLTHNEIRARHPQHWQRFTERDPHFDFCGGESLSLFARRIAGCIEELAGRHRGEQVLVFTHGGVLDVIHRHSTGRPLSAPRDFDIPNAAFNWLEAAEGKWSILSWADTAHLNEALDELPG